MRGQLDVGVDRFAQVHLDGVQVGRPPIYAWEQQCRAMRVPTLIMVGDEDEPCLNPSLFLKRSIPASGLVTFAQSGHAINLEEPALFNQLLEDFLRRVDAGRWEARDPRATIPSIHGPAGRP